MARRTKRVSYGAENQRERKNLPSPEVFDPSNVPIPVDTWPRALGLDSWEVPDVLNARNLQAQGKFKIPVRLLRSAKTDPAVFSALLNRVAPMRGLPMEIVAGDADGHAARPGGLAERAMREAEEAFLSDGGALSPETKADVNESIAAHGLAICQNIWLPRDDGSMKDVRLEVFPLEFVSHFELGPDGGRGLYALTAEGRYEPIQHGDGRWVVFAGHELEPWTWGALMPLALLWADRSFAIRDRSKNAESHGDSKWIGTMPEGVATKSAEGVEMLKQLVALYNRRRAMLKPYGSTVERVEAMAQNWQIFREIIASDNSDAAKVLLGQDGTVNNSGGNYIKSEVLFGVRNDIVEGDLSTMARAINTGTVRPWQQYNFGRVDLVRGVRWCMPDFDQDARRDSIAKRWDSFFKHLDDARKSFVVVDQPFADQLTKDYGLPRVMLEEKKIGRAQISESDIKYGGITPNELRRSIEGTLTELPAIDGGDVTVPQTAKEAAFATPQDVPAGSAPQVGGGPAPANDSAPVAAE